MSSPTKLKDSLSAHNLAPSKKFGQNFLINENSVQKIIESGDVKKTDTIIEVGVGLGALTLPLAQKAHAVIGIEIDSGFIRYHKQNNTLPENVSLIHQDVLQTDFNDLYKQVGSPLKIMANLPYSISNPFIFKLIDNRQLLSDATIMLQKEVAERLMAQPGVKSYGIPSVLLQSCASIKKLMTLKPDQFHPRPKVDSIIVKIIFSPPPAHVQELPSFNYKILQTLVRAAFGQRRKTLYNTLSSSGIFSNYIHEKEIIKKLTKEAILDSNIQLNIRGETLELRQFIALAISFETVLKRYQ